MKRKIVSLLVACTCILGLVGPASAASIDSNGESVIMPRDTLFSDLLTSGSQAATSSGFTTEPGEGNMLRIWYRNDKDTEATVLIFLEGETSPVDDPLVVSGNDGDFVEIPCSNKTATSYYCKVQNDSGTGSEFGVMGYLAVVQFFG